jgi:hypothetical protein
MTDLKLKKIVAGIHVNTGIFVTQKQIFTKQVVDMGRKSHVISTSTKNGNLISED